MPPHRRSPSGKLFRTDFRFAPSLRSAPASCFRWLPVPAAPPRRPGQLLSPAARTSSFATAPRPAASAGCPYQQLHHVTPASNKPHPAEKSTPVWLAIWRTWAGFANSQLLSAAFRSIYLYIAVPIPLAATLGCCSNRRKSVGPSAPIAYATSVSPPDEAAAWPGRRCWMQDEAAV